MGMVAVAFEEYVRWREEVYVVQVELGCSDSVLDGKAEMETLDRSLQILT